MGKILIVVSRYYQRISEMLLDGASETLRDGSREFEVIEVVGAFEIPAAIVFAIMSDRAEYSGYLALGCVIRGKTDHYQYVCDSVVRSIGEIATQHVVPMGFGVINAPTEEMALERADKNRRNVGGQAAKAVLGMVQLYQKFLRDDV